MSNLDKEVGELIHKNYESEQQVGVLRRWCLVNSVLLGVFTLLFALR